MKHLITTIMKKQSISSQFGIKQFWALYLLFILKKTLNYAIPGIIVGLLAIGVIQSFGISIYGHETVLTLTLLFLIIGTIVGTFQALRWEEGLLDNGLVLIGKGNVVESLTNNPKASRDIGELVKNLEVSEKERSSINYCLVYKSFWRICCFKRSYTFNFLDYTKTRKIPGTIGTYCPTCLHIGYSANHPGI